MNDERLSKYKLHSKGENWFHFRVKPNEYNESFTVTFCYDGIVCMTGDMGVLAWQRTYYPEVYDYGFPNSETNMAYFAEKIVRAEESQKIKTWDIEVARSDIRDAIKTYTEYGDCKKEIEVLKDVLDSIDGFENGEYGRVQMIRMFEDETHELETEDFCYYGDCYTDHFEMRFKMLQAVSDQILDEVSE